MFEKLELSELQMNPFDEIGQHWLLISAKKEGVINTMTASWGQVGHLWGKNVATVYIRPQRYTKEFIDASDKLSLSVLDEEYRKTLSYLGSVSGRDEDKIGKSGLTVAHTDDVPYFAEANTVITGKKLYAQEYRPECFIDSSLDEKWYPQKDYHTMYIAEIVKVLVRE
mgnify:CR=1 FL=1